MEGKMKNIYFRTALVIVSAIVIFSFAIAAGKGFNPTSQKQKIVDVAEQPMQSKESDTNRIIFKIPSVKCGSLRWKDSSISDWLANYCIDKCNDSLSSGYRFSGLIKNSRKSWSLKVTVKTDREYLQPVKFNPENGTFDGKVYFDKTNRDETPVKIVLRDSNRITLETFVINLLE